MEGTRAPTRVAIVDRAPIWAAGAASVVDACGFEHVGTWPDSDRALAALAECPPDIVIIAAALHNGGGSLAFESAGKQPSIILVIERGERLTPDEKPSFAGLLVRDAPIDVAAACLKSIAAGHAWMDPGLVRSMPELPPVHGQNWGCLSNRELEIAGLAADGFSNKRIAKQLHLSDGTVKMHMHHILAKLHVGSRSDLGHERETGGTTAERLMFPTLSDTADPSRREERGSADKRSRVASLSGLGEPPSPPLA